jgi:hypothetical protein
VLKNARLLLSLWVTAAVLTAAPAFAQADPRWSPWAGCWTVSVDTTRGGTAAAGAPAPRARVCLTARGNTASLVTEVTGRPSLAQTIVADGTPQPLEEGDCSGAQRAEWSRDGARLYSRAELTCAAGSARTVSGISLLSPDGTWIEAQAVEVGGRASVRVRRFRRDEPAADGAARAVPERLTVDDVIEASAHVAVPALEAALVESRATFGLNAQRLIQLEDAGVASSVIDLMVALTYPQAFSVRPTSRADRLTPFPFGIDPSDPEYPWWQGNVFGAGGYFDSPYLFSPFGYSYLGYYPLEFGAGAIVLDGGGGRGGGGRPTAGARVVNGLGYTRTLPRSAEPASSGGDSARAAAGSRGTVSSQGFSRGGSDTSSNGGTGSSGSSGGGGGGSGGGRTAVDR